MNKEVKAQLDEYFEQCEKMDKKELLTHLKEMANLHAESEEDVNKLAIVVMKLCSDFGFINSKGEIVTNTASAMTAASRKLPMMIMGIGDYSYIMEIIDLYPKYKHLMQNQDGN